MINKQLDRYLLVFVLMLIHTSFSQTLEQKAKNGTVTKDLFNGLKLPSQLVLKPYDVYLIELLDEKGNDLSTQEELLNA